MPRLLRASETGTGVKVLSKDEIKDRYYGMFSKDTAEIIDWDNVNVVDGNLVCGRCGEPLTRKFTPILARMLRRDMYPSECACLRRRREEKEEEERKKAEEADIAEKNAHKLLMIERLKIKSCMGERYVDASFDRFELGRSESIDGAYDMCRRWMGTQDGGVYLQGSSGTGKTMLMACMANELMEKHMKSTYFISPYKLSRSYASELVDNMNDADVVFIDDLGQGMMSRNGEDTRLNDTLFYVIDERYRSGKPIVVSSNYALSGLVDHGVRGATVDRIAEMVKYTAVLKGGSYRQN